MTLPRTLRWIAGIALALLALIALFIAVFDWNWLRGPIARRAGAAIGRTVEINGDLAVRLSLTPRIVLNDIVIGNAAGSSEPRMAVIQALDFRIDLFKLLTGRVDLPELTFTAPNVLLETSTGGTPNWVFARNEDQPPLALPVVGRLAIVNGIVTVSDPKKNTLLTLDVHTLETGPGHPDARLEITGKGHYKGQAATLHAVGGAVMTMGSDAPYPIEASATSGSTRTTIHGTLLDPLKLTAQKLNFTLEGADLAQLYPLFGIPMPPSRSYKLAGFLDHADKVWQFSHLAGVVGESDLAGDFAVDRGARPQKLTATLVSQKLVMRDLAGFVGADRAGSAAQPKQPPVPGTKILPTEPFSVEKLQAADVDVHFRGIKIITEKMPLENMTTHLVVKGGVLTLSPLDFGAAGGHLIAQVEMDGRHAPIATRVDGAARGLHLELMFPNSKLAADNSGTMGGRARLTGNGNSVAQILASANGEAALIMDGGSVGELTLRLANLDIANSMLLLIGGDKQTPIRCMVGNFNAVGGEFTVQDLVLDTPKVNITGTGSVNFNDESLHLRLVAKSKGFSLASLRGPVAITGTFDAPVARPELGGVAVRGGAAVALGMVTGGIGALIPLLDFGKKQESNCAALISQAKADVGVKASDIRPAKPLKTAVPPKDAVPSK